jgi:signal peptidase
MNQTATACGATARETLGCELAAEVLRSSGRLRLRATGASMLPAVWPGDILSVRSHDVVEALPGDIVLFGREGTLVAHRVVERT